MGEAFSQTMAEGKMILEIAGEEAGDDMAIMPYTSGYSMENTMELTKYPRKPRGDGRLRMPMQEVTSQKKQAIEEAVRSTELE